MSQEFATWLWGAMREAGYEPEPDRRVAGRTRFAEAAGISLSTVTRALDVGRVPEPEILRKMAPALHRSVLECFIAAGYLTASEAGIATKGDLPRAPVADVAEAIKQDTDLLEQAREHLLNQYAILREWSEAIGRTAPSQRPLRAVARKRPRQEP